MNAAEIREKKQEFKNELLTTIANFTKETGAYITSINVDTVPHTTMAGGPIQFVVSRVDIEVQI